MAHVILLQPDSEDGNEMVFCDKCDICVHQACYGVQTIPEGSWLCRPCALGIRPQCILCPKTGGAMKSTKWEILHLVDMAFLFAVIVCQWFTTFKSIICEFLLVYRSGSKWAHVSCALWIPEVSIGCAEKMEPITKISHIPVSSNHFNCSLL